MLPNQILGHVNDGFQIFIEEAGLIQNEYPGLNLKTDEKSGEPHLSGTIHLQSENGSLIDSYTLKIIAIPEYPSRFPLVFETEGRIPLNIDWHVYPSDGHFCVSSVPEEILICRKGISLHSFIEDHLIPYLFNQKYREENGFFLKERPHGMKGNIQFFTEIFKTEDLIKIAKNLNFIKQRKEPKRVNQCFCGSGLKYRKCHREAYKTLSAFTDNEIDLFIEMIVKYQISSF